MTPKEQEAETKLDLARAYEEMDDREGAIGLFREVLDEGNDAQRKTARSGMWRLGVETPGDPASQRDYGVATVFAYALALPHADIVNAARLYAEQSGSSPEAALADAVPIAKLAPVPLACALEAFARGGCAKAVEALLASPDKTACAAAKEALARTGSAASVTPASAGKGIAHRALAAYLAESRDPLGLLVLVRLCAAPADMDAFLAGMQAWPGAMPAGLLRLLGSLGDSRAMATFERQWRAGADIAALADALAHIHDTAATRMLVRWLCEATAPERKPPLRAAIIALTDRRPQVRAVLLDACTADEACCVEESGLLLQWHGAQGVTLLVRCLGSRFRHVREGARQALLRVTEAANAAELTEQLLALLRDAKDAEVREGALACLAGRPEATALAALGAALASTAWKERRIAACALGQRGDLGALSLLARVLGDPHPLVRIAVRGALDAIIVVGDDEAKIEGLLQLATGKERLAAECAAIVLERIAAGEAGARIDRVLATRLQDTADTEQDAWVAIRARLERVATADMRPAASSEAPAGTAALIDEIADQIKRSGELGPGLLDAVPDICTLFHAERVTVYVVSGDGGSIVSIVKSGLNSFKDLKLPISSESLAGHSARTKAGLNVADAYDREALARVDPALKFLDVVDQRTGFRTRQVLAVPVLDPGNRELLGVVQLLNHRAGIPFPPTAEIHLRRFCRAVASAFRPVRVKVKVKVKPVDVEEDEFSQQGDAELIKLCNKLIADAHKEGASTMYITHAPGKAKSRCELASDVPRWSYEAGQRRPWIEIPASYRGAITLRYRMMCRREPGAAVRAMKSGSIMLAEHCGLPGVAHVEFVPSQSKVDDVVLHLPRRPEEPPHKVEQSQAPAPAPVQERESTDTRFDSLAADDVISDGELQLAKRVALRKGLDLEDILIDEFQVKAPVVGAALAKFFQVPYEPFRPGRARPGDLLRNLRREFIAESQWMPIEEGEDGLVVLCTDPARTRDSRIAGNVFPRTTIHYRVTTRREFAGTLDAFYPEGRDESPMVGDMLSGLDEEEEEDGDAAPVAAAPMVPAPPAVAAPGVPDPTAVPAAITDQVYFTVTAPKTVRAASSFVLDVWAHLEGDRGAVLARAAEETAGGAVRSKTKGAAAIERGRRLDIRVRVPDFAFDDGDTLVWSGAAGNATFGIAVPLGAAAGVHLGTATFAVDGVQISRLHFELEVGEAEGSRGERTLRERRPRSAFVSYATEDRDEVLARIQGMQKLLPDLDVFLDIVSIRSGENWAQRLEEEISRRDAFYLFWSAAASRSEWVEREWRAALRLKGLEAIDPVPLEPPRLAPPPHELGALHFNEWTLAYRGKGN